MNAAMRRLREAGLLHILTGSAAGRVLAFLTGVLAVRLLTAQEYGTYAYAWSLYGLVLLLDGLGAASAALQLGSEQGHDAEAVRRICRYGARLGLAFDAVLAAALLALGALAPLPIGGAGGLLCLLCGLPALHLLVEMTGAALRAQRQNRAYARLGLVNAAALLLLTAALVPALRERGLILAHYGACTLTLLASRAKTGVRLLARGALPQPREKRSFLSIAVVSMCNAGLSHLLYLLDLLVLGLVDPQETLLAGYRVATILPSAMTFLPVTVVTCVYPYFAAHRDDGAWCLRRFRQLMLGLGAVNLLVTAALVALAPVLLRALFGEGYAASAPLLRLLAVSFCLSATFRIPAGNLLVTQRALGFNFAVAVLSGLVNVAADFLLIPRLGATGAALATLLVVLMTGALNTGYLLFRLGRSASAQREHG